MWGQGINILIPPLLFLIYNTRMIFKPYEPKFHLNFQQFGEIFPRERILLEKLEDSVIYQHCINQTDYHEYMQLLYIPDNKTSRNFFGLSNIVREYFQIYHLVNMFISSDFCAYYNDTHVIEPWTFDYIKWSLSFKKHEGIPIYDSVVFPTSIWGENFGHFFSDVLPTLLFVPGEIMNKSYIMLQYHPYGSIRFLEILGINKSKIMHTHKRFIQVNNLYVPKTREWLMGQFTYGYPRMAYILREKLGLEKIVPTQYILANRERKRRLNNFNDVVCTIKNTFSNITWDLLNCSFSDIYHIGTSLASAKVFFSPCGSNIHNCILMHNNTGVCLAMGDRVDIPNYVSIYLRRVWVIGYMNKNIKHHNTHGGNCSIPTTIFCIDKLLYAVHNQKWPEYTSSNQVFNINNTKLLMNNVTTILQSDVIVKNDEMYVVNWNKKYKIKSL